VFAKFLGAVPASRDAACAKTGLVDNAFIDWFVGLVLGLVLVFSPCTSGKSCDPAFEGARASETARCRESMTDVAHHRRRQKRPSDQIRAHGLRTVSRQKRKNPGHHAVSEENEGKCSHSWQPIEPPEGRNLAKDQEACVGETDLDRESKCPFFLDVIDDRLDDRNDDGCVKARGIPYQTRREAQGCYQPDPPPQIPRHQEKFFEERDFHGTSSLIKKRAKRHP
jgi:hypothetical protein